jgi:hypothetical protein
MSTTKILMPKQPAHLHSCTHTDRWASMKFITCRPDTYLNSGGNG